MRMRRARSGTTCGACSAFGRRRRIPACASASTMLIPAACGQPSSGCSGRCSVARRWRSTRIGTVTISFRSTVPERSPLGASTVRTAARSTTGMAAWSITTRCWRRWWCIPSTGRSFLWRLSQSRTRMAQPRMTASARRRSASSPMCAGSTRTLSLSHC